MAVFCAVRKWKNFILGSSCTVFTDHKHLVGAVSSGKPRDSDRQQRQLSFINEYTSEVVHIAGEDNVFADTFSRPEFKINPVGIAKAQRNIQFCREKYKPFKLDKDIEIFVR